MILDRFLAPGHPQQLVAAPPAPPRGHRLARRAGGSRDTKPTIPNFFAISHARRPDPRHRYRWREPIAWYHGAGVVAFARLSPPRHRRIDVVVVVLVVCNTVAAPQ